MSEHVVGPVDAFPDGEGVGVEIEGVPIAVFNLDGGFYAIADRCGHKNAPLHRAGEPRFNSDACGGSTRGEVDAENCLVRCPHHLLAWDLDSGENPVTGDRLPTFEVSVVDGEVRIEL